MKTQIVLIFLYNYTFFVSSFYCYWNTECSYKYFSSRTSYDSVRADIRDSLIHIKQCEPISLWSIIRHGAKNPNLEYGSKMQKALSLKDLIIESHEKKKSSLCSQDIDNLKKWSDTNNMFTKSNELTEQGYRDMLHIGKRIAYTFSDLLKDLKNGDYNFKSAEDITIQNSLKAYVEGLTAGKLVDKIKKEQLHYDIIDSYLNCEDYQQKINNNPELYKEADIYSKNLEYSAIKDRIQRRTGIDYELTIGNITALYDLCRYTRSEERKFSPWCALFTTDDLKVLEYHEDLKLYHKNGYGNPLRMKFAGPVLRDLLLNFQQAKNGSGKKIVSYISHGTMTNMIYSTLGLFKDDHPLNGTERNVDRKWRSSFIRGFSSNLIAVLSRCHGDNIEGEDFNVIFYLNEQPLQAICGDGICSWEEFENLLTPFINATLTETDCKSNN